MNIRLQDFSVSLPDRSSSRYTINDTINVINANGLKQGVWVSFYDTCEKEEERYYDKGVFTGGKMFDKEGNDLHADYKSGEMVIVRVTDSLQVK